MMAARHLAVRALGSSSVAALATARQLTRFAVALARGASAARGASTAAERAEGLVVTHSTYIESLLPVLRALISDANIDRLVPARIARTRGHRERLSIAVTAPLPHGHKLIARHGRLAQEVFVSTQLTAEALEIAIAARLPRGVIKAARRDAGGAARRKKHAAVAAAALAAARASPPPVAAGKLRMQRWFARRSLHDAAR